MTRTETERMFAYMMEAREALQLIVNHPQSSGLGGDGDAVFQATINEIKEFATSLSAKYGRAMFECHTGPSLPGNPDNPMFLPSDRREVTDGQSRL